MSGQRHIIRGFGLIAFLAAGHAVASAPDPNAGLPAQLKITGTIRDFKEASVKGGHKDFELNPARGFAHYFGEVADTLDKDGKPVYASTGKKVTTEWKDSSGRPIISPRSYLSALAGDKAGAMETQAGGALTGSEAFAQWFRDVPGVNVAVPLALTLARQENSNVYTFNAATDATYSKLKGFFPINGQLFGNSGGGYAETNYHFTFELNTEFVFKKGTGQVFTFTGDDDVFVFVDGKLVIDLGGVHSAVSQTIELDRCNWLKDGKTYTLDFFFAERHRTESNCRIDTTLQLMNVKLPSAAPLYD